MTPAGAAHAAFAPGMSLDEGRFQATYSPDGRAVSLLFADFQLPVDRLSLTRTVSFALRGARGPQKVSLDVRGICTRAGKLALSLDGKTARKRIVGKTGDDFTLHLALVIEGAAHELAISLSRAADGIAAIDSVDFALPPVQAR
jgi:hypothetical protein